jgi:hypothetical protein
MWSTDDPPDIIEGTEPFCDIETAFDIRISDDDALELYDMDLDKAARKIPQIRDRKCLTGSSERRDDVSVACRTLLAQGR